MIPCVGIIARAGFGGKIDRRFCGCKAMHREVPQGIGQQRVEAQRIEVERIGEIEELVAQPADLGAGWQGRA